MDVIGLLFTIICVTRDYDIFTHTGERGLIHSNAYMHFRDVPSNDLTFLGSISEETGYTYFQGDFNRNTLTIHKDCLGKHLPADTEIVLLRVFVTHGLDECVLWDDYISFFPELQTLHSPAASTRNADANNIAGWTSWYNYYEHVTERDVIRNLNAMHRHGYPIDVFQIDDGYQTAVGDWLSISPKFPSGMKALATRIRSAGYIPGLWLAPFAVGIHSRLVKEHPDWLVCDLNNPSKFLYAGPNWGGFYALDIYNPQVRAHLQHVFNTVINQWGFSLLKLDFLFAAAMAPRAGRSRGEIMWDAAVLLRSMIGPDCIILGCGTPMAPAFRRFDFCRIGSDVAPWWDDSALRLVNVRERVSTVNSLVSTLNRWQLNARAFGNDPDVVILRKESKLTKSERGTLCVLNNVLGALVFTSDDVSNYRKDEHVAYAATFPKVVANVKAMHEFRDGVYIAKFEAGGRFYSLYTNLSSDQQLVHLPIQVDAQDVRMYFAQVDAPWGNAAAGGGSGLFYHPSAKFVLHAHQTQVFYHILQQHTESELSVTFVGSTGHIVPGTELISVEILSREKTGVHLEANWHPKKIGKSMVMLELAGLVDTETVWVNGQKARWVKYEVRGGEDPGWSGITCVCFEG